MTSHEVLDLLCKLAANKAKQCRSNRLQKEGLRATGLQRSLRPIAVLVSAGEKVQFAEILGSLFSVEACLYLLEMPNRYSFWATVRGACIYQEIMGAQLPVSLRATRLAYDRVAEELVAAARDQATGRISSATAV